MRATQIVVALLRVLVLLVGLLALVDTTSSMTSVVLLLNLAMVHESCLLDAFLNLCSLAGSQHFAAFSIGIFGKPDSVVKRVVE